MSQGLPSKTIPAILNPYFHAIADRARQEAWMVQIYHDKIVPYVEHLIKEFSHNHQSQISNLLFIQSFLKKNKSNLNYHEKLIYAKLQSKVKNPNQLAAQIENSFYYHILSQKEGFSLDSFLPSTLNKHLKQILEVQLLISMQRSLATIDISQENHEATQLKTWVSKEIGRLQLVNKLSKNTKEFEFNSVQPSRSYYFFNGASHLFIFCQLECLNVKNIISDWLRLIIEFKNKAFSISDVVHLSTVASLKFVFNLFLTSLMPYRFLRTLGNQISNTISSHIQNAMATQFPIVSRSRNWFVFNYLFQLLIFVALILSIGLPLVPLPLAAIPEIFVSMSIFYLSLMHSASVLAGALLCKVVDKISSKKERESLICKTEDDKNSSEVLNFSQTINTPCLMFDRHCARQQTLNRTHPLMNAKEISKKQRKFT